MRHCAGRWPFNWQECQLWSARTTACRAGCIAAWHADAHAHSAHCTLRCLAVQVKLHVDTVVVDEAGCVSEIALPTLINLAPSQLVLIGDHLQLPSYTDLRKPPPNHTRRCAARGCKCKPGAHGVLCMACRAAV